MNARRFTEQLKFNAAGERLTPSALPKFPTRMLPPGPLLLYAAGSRAGLPMAACTFNGGIFLYLFWGIKNENHSVVATDR